MNKSLKSKPVWALILALILVVGCTLLFVGAAAGWFSEPTLVTLDPEYYTSDTSLENTDGDFLALLTATDYQSLIDQQKSFLIFIDQTNCNNADRMRTYVQDYATESGIKPYRMMFSELKNTNLKGQVKYYPSVVVISRGRPVAWLDADSDADAPAYNDYTAFKTWLDGILQPSSPN